MALVTFEFEPDLDLPSEMIDDLEEQILAKAQARCGNDRDITSNDIVSGRDVQGTGEAGVLIKSLNTYHRSMTLKAATALVRDICHSFSVISPWLILQPPQSHYWGEYDQSRRIITLYFPISLGVVIHEAVHCVVKERHPRANSHGRAFKQELQHQFILWEV